MVFNRLLGPSQKIFHLISQSLKFGELLEDVTDELEGDLSYTEDEFKNFIQENFIKIKKYLKSEIF